MSKPLTTAVRVQRFLRDLAEKRPTTDATVSTYPDLTQPNPTLRTLDSRATQATHD